jgi:hypothetical protein
MTRGDMLEQEANDLAGASLGAIANHGIPDSLCDNEPAARLPTPTGRAVEDQQACSPAPPFAAHPLELIRSS